EYALAFTVIGLAGIFANSLHQAIKNENKKAIITSIVGGVLLGGSARFLMHFIAGIIFLGDPVPTGQPAWLYSLLYNISYIAPSMLICIVVTSFLFHKQRRNLVLN